MFVLPAESRLPYPLHHARQALSIRRKLGTLLFALLFESRISLDLHAAMVTTSCCQRLRRFVQKYSDIARTLNSMLRKDAEPDWGKPTDEQTKAFDTLKTRLMSSPMLPLPKDGLPYVIDTDASVYRLGATLLQQQDEEKPNYWVPIGYWSKTLTDTERNYSTTERKCYSVVWSVTTMRQYIEGLTFTVRTHHDALHLLMKNSHSTGRLMRWRLLSEFDFTVKYRPLRKGLVKQVPDGLSRVLISEENEDKPIHDKVRTYGDHEAVFVTTRRKAANSTPSLPATTARKLTTRKRAGPNPMGARRMNTRSINDLTDEERLLTDFQQNRNNHDTTNDGEAIDDVLDEDLNIFDVARAYKDYGRDPSTAGVPVRWIKNDFLQAQSTDEFCQTVLPRQSENLDTHFFECNDGLLGQ